MRWDLAAMRCRCFFLNKFSSWVRVCFASSLRSCAVEVVILLRLLHSVGRKKRKTRAAGNAKKSKYNLNLQKI